MLKFIFHAFIALMLVISCECKDMHVRRMPEEKDIAFKGEVKKPQKAVYRKGASREIQVHLTSSDEEAQDAQFKILSATLADGSPADLDYTSLKLGKNTLHYTPQKSGTHELTLKVAVEGEEESAQIIPCTIEAPAANWQVRGTANDTGNLTIHIADVPEELQGESWRITNTTWSRGLRGTIADTSTLRSGDNNLQVALLTPMALEEPPTLHMTVENDGEEQSMSIDLRTLCIARLEETFSVAQIQTLRAHNAAVEAQASTYQESYTGTAREDARRVMRRLFEETTRHQQTTTTQLGDLETNLNILRHQDPAGLAVLDTRRTDMQHELEALADAMRILQPMVTRLEESNTGPIDPYHVLREALQQGTYEATNMAPHFNSPLLSLDVINKRDPSGHTLLHYATEAENQAAIALLLRKGAEQDLIPDWQLQGSYDAPSQQLALTISDAPERSQQERSQQAQWRIANVTWSEGVSGQINPNLVLQHGENRIPLSIEMTTLTEVPTVQVILQGPDNDFQSTTLNLRAVCLAKMEETERSLAERTDNVTQYIQETEEFFTRDEEGIYHLPEATDPRENRRKQAEIGSSLGELENFQRGYEADLQAFSSNLETLAQAQVNTQLPGLEFNNQSLKDAIASLRSAQVQLQMKVGTAHSTIMFLVFVPEELQANGPAEDINQALTILSRDPKMEVNRDLVQVDGDDCPKLIFWAARGNHPGLFNTLIARGATTTYRNCHGHNVLHVAVKYLSIEMVREIIRIDPDLVSERDNKGMTPLDLARKRWINASPTFIGKQNQIASILIDAQNSLSITP